MILDPNPDRLEPKTEWLRDEVQAFREQEIRALEARRQQQRLIHEQDNGPAVIAWIFVMAIGMAVIAFLVIGGR